MRIGLRRCRRLAISSLYGEEPCQFTENAALDTDRMKPSQGRLQQHEEPVRYYRPVGTRRLKLENSIVRNENSEYGGGHPILIKVLDLYMIDAEFLDRIADVLPR